MVTVFKYKQKIIPKIEILIFMAIIPTVFGLNESVYSSFLYYLIPILLEIIAFVYYSSKRLIITENGIDEKIFWSIVSQSTKWEDMEEACEITRGGRTYQNTSNSIPALMAYTDWLERMSNGATIKIIITNREAKYLNLHDIKNDSELNKILIEKIRFVKN